MRPLFTAVLCLIFLSFFACEEKSALCNSVIEGIAKDSAARKPIYIVLCDFTASMDSGSSLKYAQNQAVRILDLYYNKAVILFYPISNASAEPLFKSDMISVDSSILPEQQKVELSSCLSNLKAIYIDSLKRALNIASRKRSSPTYIIQSLENAIANISQLDGQQKNRNVIFILSDMLESGTSSFGSINLEDKNYDDDIVKVDSAKLYGTSLIGTHTEIKVCLYTQNMINPGQLTYFWNLVFRKLGYNKDVVLSSEAGL